MSILDKHIITRHKKDIDIDFQEGSVILVDKPLDWTSFDVVNKIKYKLRHNLGVKKIKVGHAGTLDPLATGLLLVCTGKLTKNIDSLQAQQKTYSGHIMLGATTDTYDREFTPNAHFPTDHITKEMMVSKTMSFLGEIDQMPPIYPDGYPDAGNEWSRGNSGDSPVGPRFARCRPDGPCFYGRN